MPLSQGPRKDGFCYATQNRQDAVKALAEQCDLVIVVGSPNSSNSRRLEEVAVARGIDAYLVDGQEEIEPAWLAGKQKIGVTAGASVPEILVRRAIDRIDGLTRPAGGSFARVEGRILSQLSWQWRCRGRLAGGGFRVSWLAHSIRRRI